MTDTEVLEFQPDEGPTAEDLVLSDIRIRAVTDVVTHIGKADPQLAEIFQRRRGLGGSQSESLAEIAVSLGLSTRAARGLDRRAAAAFRADIHDHRHAALLPAA